MVESAGSEDTIVVSFAGHGLRDDDALRLVLSSTSLNDLGGTSLAFADVAVQLRRARARVLVLLDVCHAGVSDRLATNDDAVSQLVTASGASMIVLSGVQGPPTQRGGRKERWWTLFRRDRHGSDQAPGRL